MIMKKIILLILIFLVQLSFSQTSDNQFNSFFENFLKAVKNENVTEIAEFINFPFHSYWGNGEFWITKESFLANKKYHTVIPQFNILSKAEFDKQKTITDQGMKIDVKFSLENGLYIISYLVVSEEEGDDGVYCFTIENGEYKYSKMINSPMNGPPYDYNR